VKNLQVRIGERIVIGDDRWTYAEMRAVGSVSDVLKLARLFAAAPELYEALDALFQANEIPACDGHYERARAALLKANPSQ